MSDEMDVSLVYKTHDGEQAERVFLNRHPDDVVFLIAGLAGRGFQTDHYCKDMEQLRASREEQVARYTTEVIGALHSGLGWWRRLLPQRVRERIVRAQVKHLADLTAIWTGELINMHAELERKNKPLPAYRARSAPQNGPGVRCVGGGGAPCTREMRLGQPLPKGWTVGADNRPRCPEHPIVVPGQRKAA